MAKQVPARNGGTLTRPDKGETMNPNGRPKKTYSQHIQDIKDKGYKPPVKEEYREMLLLLLAMSQEDLNKFQREKERPYWIRLLIADIKNKYTRQKIMSDHRDWLYGKATQSIDLEMEATVKIDYTKISTEALKEINEASKN